MGTMIDWLKHHYQWLLTFLFGGGGVIFAVIRAFRKCKGKHSIAMHQKSGKNSVNIQAGGNINVGK